MNKPGLYLVTGPSGSGKSTVRSELSDRGFEAIEGDTIAEWVNKKTGEPATDKNPTDVTWVNAHHWQWKPVEIDRLTQIAESKPIFFCGSGDHTESYWPKFTKVFLLIVSDEEQRERIFRRTEHDYGKGVGQFEAVLEWKKELYDIATRNGAISIDANRPIAQITDDILRQLIKAD